MLTLPVDILNRAIDACAQPDMVIGDLQEGTEAAKIALRWYAPSLREMLRASYWPFARKMAPLTLLADATGQTAGVGTAVIPPWAYEYAYPGDCVRMRFVPVNYNLPQTNPPPTTGNQIINPWGYQLPPAPFQISLDTNYPFQVGAITNWDQEAQWWEQYGLSPQDRTVVLTNVKQAWGVYTALVTVPNRWDDDFIRAMVALLAHRMALPLNKKDKSFALQLMTRHEATAERIIADSRAKAAQEAGFPQSTDSIPDWIRRRNSGAYGGAFGWGASGPFGGGFGGGCGGGFDDISWGSSSVF